MVTGMQEQDAPPYATLIDTAAGYFHPEVYYDVIDELKEFGALPEEEQPVWLRRYRYELKEALIRHSEGLDRRELFRWVQEGAMTHAILLRRFWAEPFPDAPIPGVPEFPFDSLYTITEIYFRDRDPDENWVHPDHLKNHFELPDRFMSPLERAIKPDLTRQLAGDFEGLDMVKFRGKTSAYYWYGPESGDDKAFARHVWQHLFPDQPLPS